MDLKKWKLFDKLDPGFAASIKRVYLVGMNLPTELNEQDGK